MSVVVSYLATNLATNRPLIQSLQADRSYVFQKTIVNAKNK